LRNGGGGCKEIKEATGIMSSSWQNFKKPPTCPRCHRVRCRCRKNPKREWCPNCRKSPCECARAWQSFRNCICTHRGFYHEGWKSQIKGKCLVPGCNCKKLRLAVRKKKRERKKIKIKKVCRKCGTRKKLLDVSTAPSGSLSYWICNICMVK
jgi:hypothetical protein